MNSGPNSTSIGSPSASTSNAIRSEGQNVQVYFKKEGEKFKGLVVIATEPTELTFVDLVGPITPEDLRALGGQFGIPKVVISHDAGKKGENR